jgi:phosphohistidine phosphatase
MNLYLMRHGEAVSPSEWPKDDSSRPLSALGSAKVEATLLEMKRLGFQSSRLLTSPLVRAKQTTDLIEKIFPSLSATVCPDLAAGSTLQKLMNLVKKYGLETALWVVGHMPDLAIFGSRMSMEPSVLERGLRPGEILGMEVNTSDTSWGEGRILWYRSLEDWKKLKEI